MSRLIDADALEKEGWSLHRTVRVDRHTSEYQTKPIAKVPTIKPEPQWIPCSERLPEDKYVLISKKPTKLSGSKWCVTIAIRMADPRSRKVNWRDIGFDVIQDNEVLAWMPLPEPWEEGEYNEQT